MITIDTKLIGELEDGINTINRQHKMIYNLTTDLFAHCMGDEEEENRYFGTIIQDALELFQEHFKLEEDLMLKTKYDIFEFTDHKKEHDGFVAGVSGYVNTFFASGNINLLMFSSYSRWWVIGHIKRFDKKYVAFFNRLTEDYGLPQLSV